MLHDATLVAFIATRDRAAALGFYEQALGLRLLSADDYALVFETPHAQLRVQIVNALDPQPFTAVGWRVDNVEWVVAGLIERGVVFERYDGLEQDRLGIWSAPGGARVAWLKDPDGNTLSLSEY